MRICGSPYGWGASETRFFYESKLIWSLDAHSYVILALQSERSSRAEIVMCVRDSLLGAKY